MPTISIIVPVYNVEKYIKQCVESILAQNNKDFELILVDDGSTDNSGKIIDSYSNENNVFVYHKENGGPSDARNYGIEKCNGKYIMFVDADDYLSDTKSIEKIINKINSNEYDVILYRTQLYYEKNNKMHKEKILIETNSNKTIDVLSIQNRNGRVSPSPCDKITKSSIIKDNNIYFDKNMFCEDIMWSNNLYLYVNTIGILNDVFYTYRQQREGSTMTERKPKTGNDLLKIIRYWFNYEYNDNNYKNLYYNYLSFWSLILLTTFNRKSINIDSKDFLNIEYLIRNYHENYKVKIAYYLSKIIGFNNTIIIMNKYVYIKDNFAFKI